MQHSNPTEKIDYPTLRNKLIMPEYGRHIQLLIEHATTIEDRAERTKCAKGIVDVMGNLFPQLRDTEDFQHILWDHIAIMSNFELDIDYPGEIIKKENVATKPDLIPYPNTRIKYMHYGRNIEKMIEKAAEYEEGEEKNALIRMIANQMKKSFLAWNKDGVDDSKIFNDLRELSNGRIDIPANTIKLIHHKQANPSGGGGKKNNRNKRKKSSQP